LLIYIDTIPSLLKALYMDLIGIYPRNPNPILTSCAVRPAKQSKPVFAVRGKVVDSVISQHVKHVITNKFVIGTLVTARVLETIIKLFIELYGDDKIEREIKRATLGRVLKVFENNVMLHLP